MLHTGYARAPIQKDPACQKDPPQLLSFATYNVRTFYTPVAYVRSSLQSVVATTLYPRNPHRRRVPADFSVDNHPSMNFVILSQFCVQSLPQFERGRAVYSG